MLLALSLNSAALQQLPELWQKVVEIFREIFRMTGSSGWLWLIFETLNGWWHWCPASCASMPHA